MTKIADIDEFTGRLTDLVGQVQAGNEVLLTQDHKPVAKLVPASNIGITTGTTLQIRSLKGHRVLTPSISQSGLAEELFGRQ